MDPIVHFELPVNDVEAAKKFYGGIFGWRLSDWPMQDGSVYTGVNTVDVDEKTHMPLKPGAINGGIVKKSSTIQAPVFAVHVSSIDDYVKKIEAAGGKVVLPKVDIMGTGFYAYVADPEGNVIGLWEDAPKKA